MITPILKVPKAEVLIPNKIAPLLSETINNHDDSIEGDYGNEMVVIHLALSYTVDDRFMKPDDPHKRNMYKEHNIHEFENMKSLEKRTLIQLSRKIRSIKGLKNSLTQNLLIFQALFFIMN